MIAPFQASCDAAAERWDVPALAAGMSLRGTPETAAVGCEVDTVFRIASITKPLTATLALALLDLEAATGVWPDDVRIRHLLSHTSGYDCECGDLARFGAADDALARAVAELPAVRRFPGAEAAWSYANTGYWLVAHIAAERAGASFEEALADRVLAPAGLESTSFGEPELAGTGAEAKTEAYPRARRASGGLVSTVPDMLRFGNWHLAQPGSAALRVVHGKPPGGVYGLGLFGERLDGTEVWGHSGSYGGFQSSLLLVPDREAVFVGLTNSSTGRPALRELEDVFFERVLGARRRIAPTVELAREVLDSYTGSYVNDGGGYDVARANTSLVVSFEGKEHAARPVGDRIFELTGDEHARERFDFPLAGFARFGSRLAERIS